METGILLSNTRVKTGNHSKVFISSLVSLELGTLLHGQGQSEIPQAPQIECFDATVSLVPITGACPPVLSISCSSTFPSHQPCEPRQLDASLHLSTALLRALPSLF